MGAAREVNRVGQWEKYMALADTEARTTEQFQAAGNYANTVETPDTTDEEWAEAFWTAYLTEDLTR